MEWSDAASDPTAPRLRRAPIRELARYLTIPSVVLRRHRLSATPKRHLEALTPELAQRAGELLASISGSNAVDATVIASAAQRGDLVVTGDGGGLRELAHGIRGVTVERLR